MSCEKTNPTPKNLSADSNKENNTGEQCNESSLRELKIDDSHCKEFQDSFDSLIESCQNHNITSQQLDEYISQSVKKILKVTEPLSLGTQRAFVDHLLKREEGWKEKFKLLRKEVIKLKNTIDEHNASLSGIIKPKIFCNSVGVQANLSNSLEVASNQQTTDLILNSKTAQSSKPHLMEKMSKPLTSVNQSSNSAPKVALSANQLFMANLIVGPVHFGISLVPHKHPPASTLILNQNNFPVQNKFPPIPILKVVHLEGTHDKTEILLSWDLNTNESHIEIASYQIFIYPKSETGARENKVLQQIGEVQAQQLPMTVLIRCLKQNKKCYFVVRAVNVDKLGGQLSTPHIGVI